MPVHISLRVLVFVSVTVHSASGRAHAACVSAYFHDASKHTCRAFLSLRYQRTSQMQIMCSHGPPPRFPPARISPSRDLVLTACLHNPAGQEANWPRCVNKHSLRCCTGLETATKGGPFVYQGRIVGMDVSFFPPVAREFRYPCAVGAADPCAVGAADAHTQSFITVHPACVHASHTNLYPLTLPFHKLARQATPSKCLPR